MDVNFSSSKFFTPIMNEIFPLYWREFNINDNYVYLLNTMFRYILIKEYGDQVLTMRDDLEKIKVYDWPIYDEYDMREFYKKIDDTNFCLTFCDDNFIDKIEVIDGFEELNSPTYPINSFIKSGSRKTTRVFINRTKRQVIACLTGKMTDNWMGRFLSCASRIWQWVFNDKNTTEDDLALLKSLSECNWGKTLECFNNIAPDYSNKYFKAILGDYQKRVINYQISDYNNKINDFRKSIDNYRNSLQTCLDRLANANIQIQSLMMLKNTQTDELTPFFDCHKNIVIRDIQQDNYKSYILYTINEILEFYDVDEFKRIYDNRERNYLHLINNKLLNVLYAMFVDDKGHFLVQSEFKLNFLSSITPLRKGNISGVTYNNVLPHPHLGFFGCLGGNEIEISKAMERGNWDVAIEQTIAATKNLAFGDNAVMSQLLGYLAEHQDTQFILANNNTKMSINEFADYIGYKEANNGETN